MGLRRAATHPSSHSHWNGDIRSVRTATGNDHFTFAGHRRYYCHSNHSERRTGIIQSTYYNLPVIALHLSAMALLGIATSRLPAAVQNLPHPTHNPPIMLGLPVDLTPLPVLAAASRSGDGR